MVDDFEVEPILMSVGVRVIPYEKIVLEWCYLDRCLEVSTLEIAFEL